MNREQEMAEAVAIAGAAAQVVLEHFGRVTRLTKYNAEAVTEADRASQRLIISELRRRFPGDGVVGEENERGDAITFDCPDPGGRVWVIDPLDGTNNFVAGLGIFAVCIALLEAGRPVVGVVRDVCSGRTYSAAAGLGAFRDGRPVKVAGTPLRDGAMIMVTANVLDAQGRLPGFAVKWMSQTAWKVRVLGSAALETAHVAAGVAHAALTVNGKLWDAAAGAALVLEAGGRVIDLRGRDVFPFDLRGYTGQKVPFLAAAPSACDVLLEQIMANP